MIGDGYRSGVVVVPMLLMSYLFLGLFYNVAIWYKLADKTLFGAYITVGGSIITLVLSALLLPTIGMIGSAWASLACFTFMLVSCYLLGQKYFPIKYPVTKILKYFFLTSLLLLFSWWLRSINFGLLLQTIIHTVVLATYTYFMFNSEKQFIQSHLKF